MKQSKYILCAIIGVLSLNLFAQKPILNNEDVESLTICAENTSVFDVVSANRSDFFKRWNYDGKLGKVFTDKDSINGILNFIHSMPVEDTLPYDVYYTNEYIQFFHHKIVFPHRYFPRVFSAMLLKQRNSTNTELIWIDPWHIYRGNYMIKSSIKFYDWLVYHQDSINQ